MDLSKASFFGFKRENGRVGVRKIERFREWLHDELADLRADTSPEIWLQPEFAEPGW